MTKAGTSRTGGGRRGGEKPSRGSLPTPSFRWRSVAAAAAVVLRDPRRRRDCEAALLSGVGSGTHCCTAVRGSCGAKILAVLALLLWRGAVMLGDVAGGRGDLHHP